jgi:hypothetical protein
MMNLYYDPILGLCYSFQELIELNLDLIPQNYTCKDFLELWRMQGITLVESNKELEPAIHIISEINTNAYLN